MTAEQSSISTADSLTTRAIVARDKLAKLLACDATFNRAAVEQRHTAASTTASHFLALRSWQVGRPRQPALAVVGSPLEPFLLDLERYVDAVAETLGLDLSVPAPALPELPAVEQRQKKVDAQPAEGA